MLVSFSIISHRSNLIESDRFNLIDSINLINESLSICFSIERIVNLSSVQVQIRSMMSISHRLIWWQSCQLVNSLCANINHWFDLILSDWFYQLDQVYQFNLSLMFIMVNPTLAADGKMLNDQPEFIINFKSITSQINQLWSNHNIGDRCLDRWTPVKSNQNQIYSINQVVNQNAYAW